ncbi:MAG: hypothetical protein KDI65_12505 [Alphaproteobacteria bacterium]|nr:hypothetical protein [Alphaproteobacteria bacterium]
MEHKKVYFLQFFLLYCALAISASRIYQLSVHPDTAWLTMCAQRLLGGMSLTDGCYDTNPPLSVLIHIPAVLLNQLTGLQLYNSITVILFVFIVICIFATHVILTRLSIFNPQDRLIFMIAYTVSIVIDPRYNFSQRDHLIAAALIPFFLVQYTLTQKTTIPSGVKHLALTLGTAMIMVKPHYGLLPVIMLLHRSYVQKRLPLDLDFLYLFFASLFYGCVIFFFFPDFLTTTLPDIAHYYLPYTDTRNTRLLLIPYGLWSLLIPAMAFLIGKENTGKKDFFLLCWAAICVAIIAFYVQSKGFFYQLIPTRTFFYIALSTAFYSVMEPRTKLEGLRTLLSIAICISLAAYPLYQFINFSSRYTTHSFFLNAPLTKAIKKECASPCSFFITLPFQSLNIQTSFYINEIYASRFPAYWFYPVMEYSRGIPVSVAKTQAYQEQIARDKKRFTRYVVEDLQRFQPNVLFLYKDPEDSEEKFDFFSYFSDDENFRKLAGQYAKTGEFTAERSDYFHGTSMDYPYTLRWDVYKRVENFAPEQQRNENNE